MNLVLKYSFFATVATSVNILFQYIIFSFYNSIFGLYTAMFWGTLAGLVTKYTLDKKYIFYHTPKSKIDDGKKFVLYSTTGISTTIIFWGSELGFNALFEGKDAKYIGAILGLGIGYATKYFLDKKYVFAR